MPLLDAYGREIPIRVRSKRGRKPKNKKQPARVPAARNQYLTDNAPVEVTLLARHTINGEVYGPGKVRVARKIANGLVEQEQRARRADANFAGTKACVIGPGAHKGGLTVTEVAPEYFDMPELGVVPFGVVDRNSGLFRFN